MLQLDVCFCSVFYSSLVTTLRLCSAYVQAQTPLGWVFEKKHHSLTRKYLFLVAQCKTGSNCSHHFGNLAVSNEDATSPSISGCESQIISPMPCLVENVNLGTVFLTANTLPRWLACHYELFLLFLSWLRPETSKHKSGKLPQLKSNLYN